MELFDKLADSKKIAKKWFFVKHNIKATPNQGVRYWRYRILRPLLKMNFKLFRLINHPTPWIAPAASKILDSLLDRSHTCLEYGSGISTIFLSKRVGNLVSIEHYQPWFDKVNQLLRKNAITNVDYRFVSGREIKKQPEKLTKKIKHQIQFGDSYFEYSAYASEVNLFPQNHFDIAFTSSNSPSPISAYIGSERILDVT